MKITRVYTRGGDHGQTSLVGGQRVSKATERLDAYGTVDELNAHLGLLAAMLPDDSEDKHMLEHIQNSLFNVGTNLATDQEHTPLYPSARLADGEIENLERTIDDITALLPECQGFILPGGTPEAAQTHVCRTVCRRAERCILRVAADCPIDPRVTAYVNRLSDLLFALARKQNVDAREEETVWMPQGVKGGE